MRTVRWTTLLWPGLPQLWIDGAWSGLVMAVGFAGLLNLALISTLIWTELLTPDARLAAWGAVALVWVGCLVSSWLQVPRPSSPPPDLDATALFCQAQAEYLSGNWYQAQTSLDLLLEVNPNDAPARLMLATLLRRTGQVELARSELERLERSDEGYPWHLEIHREWQHLTTAAREMHKPPAAEATAKEAVAGENQVPTVERGLAAEESIRAA